ncbi:hypothetical protein [Bradyrhizobium niftali]|uniref:Uncharacterized protein n=1 Tax=Bradyrhizobium niftali TaxID=2560055 RepID=A0A4Y9M3R4_9BRAD|nr:hypothetical protein [Bradyrhizobium niftali]TFV49790.1 hypothetical protein E4K65_06355 [Bradyrhizobium niftali]
MRRTPRLIAAAVLIAFTGVLGGCSSFDPTDLLDFLDTKKKLPGDRKPVFPEGVPGLEQGVPKDLYKGAQQQPDPNAPAVAALPAEPPPEQAKPGKGAKAKKARQPAAGAAAPADAPAGEVDGEVQPEAAPPTAAPPPKQKIVRKRTTVPPPDQPVQQAQPTQTTQQQSQQGGFPAPLPSGSFSR